MKKLILSLMVLASLVSCGKNNSVGSPAGASTGGISNPIIVNNPTAQALLVLINNPYTGFGQGMTSQSSSNQDCGTTLFGLIHYCTYGGAATQSGVTWNSLLTSNPNLTYQYSSGRTVRNSDVTIGSKQDQLRAILNSATNIQTNGQAYFIMVSGTQYLIDARLPIQANPIGTASQIGSEYFVRAI